MGWSDPVPKHGILHSFQKCIDMPGTDISDGTNAESLPVRDLAGIDDNPP